MGQVAGYRFRAQGIGMAQGLSSGNRVWGTVMHAEQHQKDVAMCPLELDIVLCLPFFACRACLNAPPRHPFSEQEKKKEKELSTTLRTLYELETFTHLKG